jgi:hypothetical protein
LADNKAGQEERQDEQTADSCEIAINLHRAPHATKIGNRVKNSVQQKPKVVMLSSD